MAEINLLTLIENIVCDDDTEEWEWLAINHKLRGRAKEMQAKLSAIYKIAHAYNPDHSCYYVHEKWRREATGGE